MKNFVAVGNTLTVQPPALDEFTAGQGVLIGSLFGVVAVDLTLNDLDAGVDLVVNVTGIYDLPKAPSQAWAVGALIYWDADNSRCTNVASTNVPIGTAVAPVGGTAGEIVGRVRLNGAAVAAASGGG